MVKWINVTRLHHLGVELLLWIPVQRNQIFLDTPEQCKMVFCLSVMFQGEPEVKGCDFWMCFLRRTSPHGFCLRCRPFKKCNVSFISNLLVLVTKTSTRLELHRGNASGSSTFMDSLSNAVCIEGSSKGRKWSDRSHCNDQWIIVWYYSKCKPLGTGFLEKCKLYP